MAHSSGSGQIRVIVKELTTITEKLVTKLALDIVAQLKQTTPVDTGWARANWLPTTGSPASPLSFPDTRLERSALVPSASGTQTALEANLLSYSLAKGSIFITNNVPYIEDLNMGTSKKAPSGFVQAAIKQSVLNLAAVGLKP